MSSITGYNPATVATLTSGTYRHVALSISGTWHTLYLDGVQVAQNLSGGNVFASYTSAVPNLYIGCAGDLSYGFAGSIDDFKIWNRVLPSADISSIYWSQYVPPPPGPLDSLSASAKTAMLGTGKKAGALGVKLLYSGYTGPTIRIKNGTGGTAFDFYADAAGNLGTGYLGTGTSLTTQLGAANPAYYVVTWYDQTGNGKHGTGAGATLPFYNTTTKVVDFGTVGYFTLTDGSYPNGNLPYSYIYKQGNINTSITTIAYSGGAAGTGLMDLLLVNAASSTFNDSWYALDYNITQSANSVIAATYDGINGNSAGKKFYINNVLMTNTAGGQAGNRNQGTTGCYVGNTSISGYSTYNSTMPYFYWAPYQLSLTDITTLSAT